MLEIRLLGQFDVRLDGQPVVLSSRAAQSLLAYLLLNPKTRHRREKLAGLLWPDIAEANARRNLRQELWRIRKALPAPLLLSRDFLLSDDFSIGVDPNAEYWLDVAALNNAASASASADALLTTLLLYQGELLPGFYDEWVALERERLRAVFEQQMQRAVEQLVATQQWPEVLQWSERWIALGQSPEPAYRALMSAHAALGNRAQVASVFERCVAALQQDLGVEPSAQTRALYEQLLTKDEGGRLKDKTIFTSSFISHPSSFPESPPFKGLRYFDEADADLFFGREQLTAQLVAQVSPHPNPPPYQQKTLVQGRVQTPSPIGAVPTARSAYLAEVEGWGGGCFLAVVGASGSGKSSLVRAGLIPALRRHTPSEPHSATIHLITPTAHPLEALAVSLTREVESVTATATLLDDMSRDARTLRLWMRKHHDSSRDYVLVVDQFEEVFTLCRDEAERKAFVDNLLGAISNESTGTTIVITLRADFYAHCAQYVNLRESIAKHQAYIGSMGVDELRRAIEEPAKCGGWEFEAGLVDLLLREVGDEPGALPLLSHALLETWKRREGRTLTLAGYNASGGVRGAIAQTAESVYQQMSAEQQAMARNIFLRLTELGEGTQDTRRRAALTELIPPFVDARAAEAVIKTLADARLITTGEGYAEVAHEALIREWPLLREWLNQNREGLRLHRHLTEAAQAWQKLNRDPGELYRGTRLAQILEWAETHRDQVNPLEREFLDASKEMLEREEAEREAQRQRELVAIQKLAEAERRRAEEQAEAAQKLADALLVAENEHRVAFARELSLNAVSNLEIDPERSILLALQAVSVSSAGGKPVLREAEEALHRAVLTSRVQLTLRGHTFALRGIAFSPDGRRLATSSTDQTAKVWDVTTGKELLTLSGHTAEVFGIAFSPDGTRVATASADQTAKVWDVSTALNPSTGSGQSTGAETGKELLTLRGHTDQLQKVAYSPDGRLLVTAAGHVGSTPSLDHTAKVWDAATGKLLLTLDDHSGSIRGIAFSPDGTRVATASDEGIARVWDVSTGEVLLTLTGHTDAVYAAVFSPDGKRLATGGRDQTTKVWDASSGQLLLTLFGLGSQVWAVAFNQDGTRLYTASADGTTKVWNVSTALNTGANMGQLLLTLAGHTGAIRDLALSPDGTRVATASFDRIAKVWDVTPAGGREWLTLAGHTGQIFGVVFSPDGTRIATSSADKTVKVWDAATGKELLTFAGHSNELRSVAFSPDGRHVATTSWDQTAKVWDVATGQVLLTLSTQASPYIFGLGVAFSPDGGRIAAVSANNTAKIWDAMTGKELLTLSGHTSLVLRLSFSPDGKRIATAAEEPDRTAKVWDAATGKELVTLKGHTSGVYYVAFSPDGKRLATVSGDGTAKVWDAISGQVLLTLSGHTAQVNGVAFSPDGTRLATASNDGTVKVWDVAPGVSKREQPLTLYGLIGDLRSVAFSPDGRRLVTGGGGGIARVYALPIEDIVAIAKSRVTRALTTDECQKYLHVETCP